MITGRMSALFVLALFLLPLPSARADRLQLANGDEIAGKLIEMTEDTVKFRHPILGEFTIPRDKIHAIELGERRGGKRIMADGAEAPPETPEEVINRLVNPEVDTNKVRKMEKGAKRHSKPEEVVEQLRREGVSGQMMMQLHGMLPGFGSPEVQKHFEDRVTGLMSGSINVNDIRNDAIDARDQLKELMDDLGPNGAALQGYFGILDGFIKKTDPEKPLTVPSGIPPLKPTLPESALPESAKESL